MKFGLGKDIIRQIHSTFACYPEIDTVILYGSRAKGNFKTGSDIDLTFKGPGVDLNTLFRLTENLEDLNLPYKFDLSVFENIENPDFIDHIKRVGIEFYNAAKHGQAARPSQGPPRQSEQALEDALVKQLTTLGYAHVVLRDETALLANLKSQLEKHNNEAFSDDEFEKIRLHLDKGNVFERAKILRDKMLLRRDDGSSIWIEFLDQNEWCQNQYQVVQQVTMEGRYKNRYDVTLLINGLPLVQIELKRRGLDLKKAFNQINRYQKHSFWSGSGLYQYVQLFVISNGVNTKYYANNRKQAFKQTFFWADIDNNAVNQLDKFAKVFLEKCHVSKMIARYTVLNETDKMLMVLRPYQYFAVEAIVDKVKHGRSNGYVWHTTGSGKTLTSFKAAQILVNYPKVHKVIFVVDRRDLDYQTNKEFNAFSKGSVDGTSNTSALVKQLGDVDTRLIVTTIQKLNTAISKARYQKQMEPLKNQRIVFIFDECHRSQFGDTHKRITEYFKRYQMFGFTGTPIFAENVSRNQHGWRTTKDLFDECLHKYVITDAIRDENVLKFSVEYVGRYKEKEGTKTFSDIEVEAIDIKELMESGQRLGPITDYIIANHDRKTHAREFTALFCVSSVDVLIKYYELFKAKKKAGLHNLKIATIFSFNANEDDKSADGIIEEDNLDIKAGKLNQHSRDVLEGYIGEYNEIFGTRFSTKDNQSYYNYYNDIAKKVKERKVDILLVVNMFLTGFDSKTLNTLYVDKNLKLHGLIQAFSRTNRILGEQKSQGNIVCFRNLKDATDKAITLFANKDAKDTIIMAPYEDYVRQFHEACQRLLVIVPTVQSVDELVTEEDEFAFIKAFRELLRLKNVLVTFSDFSFGDLEMAKQMFADYLSKYLDLFDKVKSNNQREKVSILDDVDFELELIHRDEINVTYIIELLGKLQSASPEERDAQRKAILDLISGDAELRSKRELIEKFIMENMLNIKSGDDIGEALREFWNIEKRAAFDALCNEEALEIDKVEQIISNHLFSGHIPITDDVVGAMQTKPKILERKKLAQRTLDKIMNFIDIFVNDAPEGYKAGSSVPTARSANQIANEPSITG
jgi:type I restriction enzyme, R subunit